jgi:hypothetical protein
LIRTQSQRSPYRWIEARYTTASKSLDRVVERPRPLDGAECKSLRERTVTCVEARCSRSKRAIGVRTVLEYAQENVERGRAGRPYDRSPRSHAS